MRLRNAEHHLRAPIMNTRRPPTRIPADLQTLTPIEHRYVQSRLRGQRQGRWVLLCCIVGLMSMAAMMIQVIVTEAKEADAESVFLVSLLVGCIAACLPLLRLTWQRQFTIDDHVSLLRGTLSVYSTRLTNPQTGGGTSTRTYYIGEQRLIMPFDTENVCRLVANQQVDAFVVYVHKSNPLNWGQPGDLMHEGPTEAIVLDLADQLHVHGLLSTYGQSYFLRRKVRAMVVVLGMLFFLGAGLLASYRLLDQNPSVTVVILSVLTVGCASVFSMLWLEWACDAVERRWAPLIDDREHSERLRLTGGGSRAGLLRTRTQGSKHRGLA